MELFVYGFVNSLVLAVTAVGFCLTFGISGVANLAYGGFYILGAYLCWGLFTQLGLPYFLAVLLSLVGIGGLGFLMYWLVLLRIRGTMLSEAIVTFGLGVALLELLRWRLINVHYSLPTFAEGSMEVGGVVIDYHRLAIIGVALVTVVSLWFFSHHTKVGLACRGIAQEEQTALSLGINSDLIAALSVGLGSALAVLAAIVILPTGTILIDRGYDVLFIALAVGVVGGLENTWGIIAASFILGYAQTAMGIYVGTQWMMIVLLAAMLIVLVVKPSGLFGKFKELEERV